MTTRIADSTLEHFRGAVGSEHPTPAGVAVAAASAGFALALLVKVLTVSGRRQAPSQSDAGRDSLAASAREASQRMLQLAADDSAAFEAYLAAARMPRSTEEERQVRAGLVNSAARQAIDVPLAAAREAAAGLQVCSDAAALTSPALIADLGVAAALLAGALRAFLLCAESNLRQLAPQASHRERLAGENERHERALRHADAVLERVAAVLGTAPGPARGP